LVAEIEKEAEKVGYSLLLCCSQHNIDKEKEILGRIASKEADGAIFVTHYEHDSKDLENLALVSIDRHLSSDIPLVTTNNYSATREAIEYFINQGLKKIVYLGSKTEIPSEVNNRSTAYLDVMKENGLEPYIINENIAHGEDIKLVNRVLNEYQHAEAIFVSGYSLARLLLQSVESKGINVPNDLQIIYYDGDCSFEKSTNMTTLEQPVADIAKKCVELLLNKIENKKDIPTYTEFKCEFVKGKTTK
jgi:LacI family sucrose operon transcriptional repressor